MNPYKPLLTAIVFFVLGWFCLHLAASDLADNPSNMADTQGVPAALIYVAIMMEIGTASVLIAGLGMLISRLLSASSFRLKMTVFVLSNTLLVLASLLGISIIAGYVLDTFFSVMSAVLYLLVILLVVTSAPRRTKA